MEYAPPVPRTDDFDAAVVGGGSAGVFAAIAAARCGANTALIGKTAAP